MSTRTKKHRKLQLESLESRTMLAGNVLAALNAATGVLTLTGDAKDNGIAITTGPASETDPTWTLTVTGTNTTGIATRVFPRPTKVNVTPSVSYPAASIKGLVIDMKDGRNNVAMYVSGPTEGSNLGLTGDLTLKSGKDPDSFGVGGVAVGGKLTVTSGAGADVLMLGSMVVTGAVAVDAGSGGNDVELFGTFGNNVAIKTTTGNDDVWVAANVTGNLSIDTGTWNDYVYVSSYVPGSPDPATIGGNVTVNLGEGRNFADVYANVNGNVSITAGSGGNSVYVESALVKGNVAVNTKGGSDYVYHAANVNGNVDIKTGAGQDYVSIGTWNPGTPNTIGGSLSVDTGADDDDVTLRYTNVGAGGAAVKPRAAALAAGDVKISTGDGGELQSNWEYSEMPFFATETVVVVGVAATGKITIDGGKGDNGIALVDCSAANANVTTAAGSSMIDVTQLDLNGTGTLTIQGGAGDNAVGIGTTIPEALYDYVPYDFIPEFGVRAGAVQITTGSVDSGEIGIENSQVADSVSIKVSGGDVAVAIRNLQGLPIVGGFGVVGNVSIQTDKGDDAVAIGPLVEGDFGVKANNVSIKTGAGNDRMALDWVAAATALLELGAGDDFLACGTNNTVPTLNATGGAGTDSYTGPWSVPGWNIDFENHP